MSNVIACRPGCFEGPVEQSMRHVKDSGIDNVEPGFPEDDDYPGLLARAEAAGVTITTLAGGVQLDDEASVAALHRAIDGAAEIDVPIIFVSAKPGDLSLEEGLERFRPIAEAAAEKGVTLSLETHTPYGHNAARAIETIEAVDSPGLRFNFDTANIYFYNPKGVDMLEELRKSLPIIASVHLKESAAGEPEAFDFPVLGEGIVDFPAVFEILKGHGFIGPYTLELEGPAVNDKSLEERKAVVRACADYLKGIGAMA